MKVIKDFNKISAELKNSIPKLEKGEVRTFEMLTAEDFYYTQDGTTHEKQKVFGRKMIPTKDRIYDPYLKSYVDIGVVARVESEEIIPRFFMPGLGEYQFTGRFSFIGGRRDDEEMFEYLWISNYNGSNPNRDDSIPALFKYLDPAANAKQKTRKIDEKRDALNLASDIDLGEAREIADSFNWTYTDETVKDMVYDYADEDPKGFLSVYGKPVTKVKSDVKRALNAGFITYDHQTGKVHWEGGKGVIATVEKNDDYLGAIAEWIQTSGKNGENVIQGIRKKLKSLHKQPEAIEE